MDLAKERIRIRVSKGGHGIPDRDVERRYYESLANLKEALEICDEVNIYDNTEMLQEIIDFENGQLVWSNSDIPKWASEFIQC